MEGLVTFHCLIGWRALRLAYMLRVIFLCSKYYVTKSCLIKEFPYFLPIFLLLVCTLGTHFPLWRPLSSSHEVVTRAPLCSRPWWGAQGALSSHLREDGCIQDQGKLWEEGHAPAALEGQTGVRQSVGGREEGGRSLGPDPHMRDLAAQCPPSASWPWAAQERALSHSHHHPAHRLGVWCGMHRRAVVRPNQPIPGLPPNPQQTQNTRNTGRGEGGGSEVQGRVTLRTRTPRPHLGRWIGGVAVSDPQRRLTTL